MAILFVGLGELRQHPHLETMMLTKLELLKLLREPGNFAYHDGGKWRLQVGHINRAIRKDLVNGLEADGLVKFEQRGSRFRAIPK